MARNGVGLALVVASFRQPPPPPCWTSQGVIRDVLEGGEGGVWDPKVCVPKTARSDFPYCKFRFFPRWSLWSGRGGRGVQGGGGTPPPPMVYGHSNTCLGVMGHTVAGFTTAKDGWKDGQGMHDIAHVHA